MAAPGTYEALDIAVYTVRNDAGAIVAEFRTEDEAFAYGSHLADANRDECYTVVCGRWAPPLRAHERGRA